MKSFQVVVLLCFIKLIAGVWQSAPFGCYFHQDAKVEMGSNFEMGVNVCANASIKSGCNIGMSVNVCANASIESGCNIGTCVIVGEQAKIGPNCEIGVASNIGAYAVIKRQCTIQNSVNVGANAQIGANCEIGVASQIEAGAVIEDQCTIKNSVNVGANAEIGAMCKIGTSSQIGAHTSISNASIIGDQCKIYSSFIGSNVYIGDGAVIGEGAAIENNAVIHEYASVGAGCIIHERAVIIKTPSSADLYKNCVPLADINRVDIVEFLKASNKDVSMILKKILGPKVADLPLDGRKPNFDNLKKAISLYLLKLHGKVRYENYCQISTSLQRRGGVNINTAGAGAFTGSSSQHVIVNNRGAGAVTYNGPGGVNINTAGAGAFTSYESLSHGLGGITINNEDAGRVTVHGQTVDPVLAQEFHFGQNDKREILEDEVKDQIIRLLAIQYDSLRKPDQRSENELFRNMISDIFISNTKRIVKCDSDL